MKIIASAILLLTFLAACESEHMGMAPHGDMAMEEDMAMESEETMGM